jgi:ribonuclease HI
MKPVGGTDGSVCNLQMTNWCRPNPSWIKINSDASFFSSSGQAGAGAVVRDDSGKIVLTACVPLNNCRSPVEAEAKALLFGISLLDNCRNLNLHLETDCAALVSKLMSKDINRSEIWVTIEEIKDSLKGWNNHTISKIGRASNQVADSLAKRAIDLGHRVLKESGPDFIDYLVTRDVNPSVNLVI